MMQPQAPPGGGGQPAPPPPPQGGQGGGEMEEVAMQLETMSKPELEQLALELIMEMQNLVGGQGGGGPQGPPQGPPPM